MANHSPHACIHTFAETGPWTSVPDPVTDNPNRYTADLLSRDRLALCFVS